jgi:hypothetical protein
MKFLHGSLVIGCAASLGLTACGADSDTGQKSDGADVSSLSQALTTITLSGRVRDASGHGIAGVMVTLAGSSEGSRVTDATGNYSFAGLAPGSYSLRPTKLSCSLTPDVVNLNNQTSSSTVNFTGSGSGCGAAAKALLLVDDRLSGLLATELEQYRAAASARRGFQIEIRSLSGIDDWTSETVRNYVKNARTANPAIEGVLYVGNIKLPSFYKIRADSADVRLYPDYFEDLDATFARNQAAGTIDPRCDGTNDSACSVLGPITVPAHDLDAITPGAQSGPEIWAAFLPVGVAGTSNTYSDFASQLRPYLAKLAAYYAGQISPNHRLYMVSNDIGERFQWSWDAYGGAAIDFYGKPGPQGQVGDQCLQNGQNLCYTRWPTETFTTEAAFESYYRSFPWVAEGWQTPEVYIPQMNAAIYDAVDETTHGTDTFSLISADQARALTKGGLIIGLGGCDAAGYAQPFSPSFVNTSTLVSQNLSSGYLYGSSKALAVLSNPAVRNHYGNFPLVWRELKVNHTYLGAAHRSQMIENYARAGSSSLNLKDWASEMLLGDPFMDLN